jgi:hypothetical protein
VVVAVLVVLFVVLTRVGLLEFTVLTVVRAAPLLFTLVFTDVDGVVTEVDTRVLLSAFTVADVVRLVLDVV